MHAYSRHPLRLILACTHTVVIHCIWY